MQKPPQDMKGIASLLASHGRNGDTMLAHINPQEAAILKALGGSGTVNPETGLPEFWFLQDWIKKAENKVEQAFTDPIGFSRSITGGTAEAIQGVASKLGQTVESIASDPRKLAAVAVMVAFPGAAAAVGEFLVPEAMAGALGSTGTAIVGQTAINTALNGGDVNAAVKSALIQQGLPALNKEFATTQLGKDMAEVFGRYGAQAVTDAGMAAIMGKDPVAALVFSGGKAAADIILNNIPEVSDVYKNLPSAAQKAVSAALTASLAGRDAESAVATSLIGSAISSAQAYSKIQENQSKAGLEALSEEQLNSIPKSVIGYASLPQAIARAAELADKYDVPLSSKLISDVSEALTATKTTMRDAGDGLMVRSTEVDPSALENVLSSVESAYQQEQQVQQAESSSQDDGTTAGIQDVIDQTEAPQDLLDNVMGLEAQPTQPEAQSPVEIAQAPEVIPESKDVIQTSEIPSSPISLSQVEPSVPKNAQDWLNLSEDEFAYKSYKNFNEGWGEPVIPTLEDWKKYGGDYAAYQAAKNHQSIMDTFHAVLGRDPTPEEYQKFAGENAIQIQDAITPPSGVQVAGPVPEDVFKTDIGGVPIYAESSQAGTVNPPFGYDLLPMSMADNKPEGSYYDPTQNAWFMPNEDVQKLQEQLQMPVEAPVDTTTAEAPAEAPVEPSAPAEAPVEAVVSQPVETSVETPPTEVVPVAPTDISPDAQTAIPVTQETAPLTEDQTTTEVPATTEAQPTEEVPTAPVEQVPADDGTTEDIQQVIDETAPQEETCAEGYHWNGSMCVPDEDKPDASTTCPDGYVYDFNTQTCVSVASLDSSVKNQLAAIQASQAAAQAAANQQQAKQKADQQIQSGLSALSGSQPTAGTATAGSALKPQFLTSKEGTSKFINPLAGVFALSGLGLTGENQGAQEQSMQTPHYNYGNVQSVDEILGMPDYLSGLETQAAQGGLMASPLMAAQGGFTGTRYGQYAGGGLPTKVVHHSGKARVDFRHGDAVTGAGDGQSDDIPAMLADGEFVWPADVVAALGNGSTKAGSDKLYDMMHNIRARARSTGPKDLPPPALKSPLDYLKKAKK